MLFKDSVTIFHFKPDDNLEKLVFKNTYAHTKSGTRLSKEPKKSDMTQVLILLQDNIEKICVGDLIVLEEVNPLYTLEREIRQNYNTYIIQSIEYCKEGNIPHYELNCK